MNTFDDRKKAAEAKFKHDQEFQFKVIARRNKLLGLWAAEKMGIAGEDAEALCQAGGHGRLRGAGRRRRGA